MKGTICDYLESIRKFVIIGKPDFFDVASNVDLDLWIDVLDSNNWTNEFFDEEAMRAYRDEAGNRLAGLRLDDNNCFELISCEDASYEELRWYIIRKILKPAIFKTHGLLSIMEKSILNNNSRLKNLLELTEKWIPLD